VSEQAERAARLKALKAQVAAIFEQDMLEHLEPRPPFDRTSVTLLCDLAAELQVLGCRIRARGCDESTARMHRQMTETLVRALPQIGSEDDLAGTLVERILAAGCMLDEGLLINFTAGSA
jgi:hypothetical protein